jgi:hypothetical protein
LPDPVVPTHDSPAAAAGEDPAHADEAFDVARVLRVAVVVAAAVSGFAAAHGIATTVQHLAKSIAPATITRVEPARGGYGITLDNGTVANFPSDIVESTGRRIEPKPGMAVGKRAGSLTYSIAGEPRGGLLWALRQWLLPARVTLPLVTYFVLSWLLVFRTPQHRRPIVVEAVVVPLVKWIVIMLVLLVAMALLAGCAMLVFRMAG